MKNAKLVVDPRAAGRFLELRRIALVGASANPKKFGYAVLKALRNRGQEVVPVNPHAAAIDGVTCYADLAAVPGRLDGVFVMVKAESAAAVVRECARLDIGSVWLFRGLGSEGAVSDEALEECERHGIEVVAGACPLMFLEPVGGFHKMHRAAKRLNHSMARAS
jgi:uncharacterized protein